jgi:hypothetical protein
LDGFELDNFRGDGSLALPPVNRKPRQRRAGWFVKGPLPGDWFGLAARLPGKALHVGLALWFLSGRNKQATVKLTSESLRRFGLNRFAGRRGLSALEGAGLVRVRRHRGRCPVVEILTAGE